MDKQKLTSPRKGLTYKAKIANHTIFLRTGEYPDGKLGEIFIEMYKEGAGYRSLLSCFSITISWLLQYGVPLEKLVEKFQYTRFEPSGVVTGDEEIKMCSSILDYVFRRLGITYLKMDLGNVKKEEATKEDLIALTPKKDLAPPYLFYFTCGSGSCGFKPQGYKHKDFFNYCKQNAQVYDTPEDYYLTLDFDDHSIMVFDRASDEEKVKQAVIKLWEEFYKQPPTFRGTEL